MKHGNYFIFQGGPENLRWWVKNDLYRHSQWFWSANKHVVPGDKALIYLTAPLSRIVGDVDVIGKPFWNDRSNSMFENDHMVDKWCVEVGNPFYYGMREDLTMANLRKLFGVDWGWVRYPRGNTRVPAEILESLLELIGETVEK
jgi:hypothetical protein